MKLIESSLRNPLAVGVAVLLVCLFGLMSLRELRAHQNGEYFVLLGGGQTLKLSRSYRDKVQLFT